MTSVTFSGAPCRLALVNRSFAAFSSAASKATGVGGGAGAADGGGLAAGLAGGGGAVPSCARAVEVRNAPQKKYRQRPKETLVIFIGISPESNSMRHDKMEDSQD